MASEFVRHILDLGRTYGPLTSKSMFGGHGIYAGEQILGLVVDDRLYLKVDDGNRAEFEAVGSQPFTYMHKAKNEPVKMSYWEAPAAAIDDGDELARWLGSAAGAAARAKTKKKAPARKR